MTEQWTEIAGYSDYQISNLGRVKSFRPGKWPMPKDGRILTGTKGNNGYRWLSLCDEAGKKSFRVCCLVAEAWLGPRPDGLVICHKDGDATNDRSDNLEYKTQRENIHDKERHGTKLFGGRHSRATVTEEQALMILRSPKAPRASLASACGCSLAVVDNIRQRRGWKHLSGAESA